MAVETKRICNGTFGELWLDGDYVGECYKACLLYTSPSPRDA